MMPRIRNKILDFFSKHLHTKRRRKEKNKGFDLVSGGAPLAAPSAFSAGQWSLAPSTTDGQIVGTIVALPSMGDAIEAGDGLATLAAIQYRYVGFNGWRTAAVAPMGATGTWVMTDSLLGGSDVSLQIRAVNSRGAVTAESDVKTVTVPGDPQVFSYIILPSGEALEQAGSPIIQIFSDPNVGSFNTPPAFAPLDGGYEVGMRLLAVPPAVTNIQDVTLTVLRNGAPVAVLSDDTWTITSADAGATLALRATGADGIGSVSIDGAATAIAAEPPLFADPRSNLGVVAGAYNTPAWTPIGTGFTITPEPTKDIGRYKCVRITRGSNNFGGAYFEFTVSNTLPHRISFIYEYGTANDCGLWVSDQTTGVERRVVGAPGAVVPNGTDGDRLSDITQELFTVGGRAMRRVTMLYTPTQAGAFRLRISTRGTTAGQTIFAYGAFMVPDAANLRLFPTGAISPDSYTPFDWPAREWIDGATIEEGPYYGPYRSAILGADATFKGPSITRFLSGASDLAGLWIGASTRFVVKVDEVGGAESVASGANGSLAVTSQLAGTLAVVSQTDKGGARHASLVFTPPAPGWYRIRMTANASNPLTTIQLLGLEARSGAIPATAPVSVRAPELSALAQVGGVLSYDLGEWSGFPTPTLSVQLFSNGVLVTTFGDGDAIPSSELGKTLNIVVTATNGVGSPVAVSSNNLGPITAAPVQSPTLWVAPTGADTNPGTETQPLKNLATAWARIQPGGTIRMKAGAHVGLTPETKLPFKGGLGPFARVLIIGAGNTHEWLTTFQSPSPPVSGSFTLRGQADYVTIQNIHFIGSSAKGNNDGCALAWFGSNNTVRANGTLITTANGEIGVRWERLATGIRLLGIRTSGTGVDNIKFVKCKDLEMRGSLIQGDCKESIVDCVTCENVIIHNCTLETQSSGGSNDGLAIKSGSIGIHWRRNHVIFRPNKTSAPIFAVGGVGFSAEDRPAYPEPNRSAHILGGVVEECVGVSSSGCIGAKLQGAIGVTMRDNYMLNLRASGEFVFNHTGGAMNDSSGPIQILSRDNTITGNTYITGTLNGGPNQAGLVNADNVARTGTPAAILAAFPPPFPYGHTSWTP